MRHKVVGWENSERLWFDWTAVKRVNFQTFICEKWRKKGISMERQQKEDKDN